MSLTGAGEILTPLQFTVETRLNWSDTWVGVDYLYPLQASEAVAPSIGQALFEYRYGRSKKAGTTTIEEYDPLDLRGHYVRIVENVSGDLYFIGQFDSEELVPKGTISSVPCGNQIFTAFGICHVLDRSIIDYGVGRNASGASEIIGWVPAANKRAEATQESIGVKTNKRGNRSATVNGDGVYEFSDESGDDWSNLDICDMMLENYLPASGPVFQMGGASATLDLLHDSVELDGNKVWEVLNKLCDRRRGLGFVPVVEEDESITLFVYSILASDLVLTDITIPANPNTTSIDVDTRIEVMDCRIVTSNSVRYDKVYIRGCRMLACFTVAHADGTLENDWNSGDETAYKAAASGISGYSDLDEGTQEEKNDRYRKADRFGAVYCRQRIPAAWNGKAGDGAGGTLTNVLPVCAEDGTITFPNPAAFIPLDKRFERALPFEENKDYSGSVPDPDLEPTYLKPFAMVQDETDGHTSGKNWHMCHDPGEDLKDEGADASIYLHPTGMALSIEASPNHIYGLTLFDPSTDAVSGTPPLLQLAYTLATVAMYTDNCLLASALRDGVTDPVTVKSLRVKDAEYWAVAAGTVLGLNPDNSLQRVAGALVLRDDRPRMWEACAIALAWFGQERRAVALTLKGIGLLAPLGNLVTAINAADVALQANTILSSRMVDFSKRTVTIETQYIEFDWAEDKGR